MADKPPLPQTITGEVILNFNPRVIPEDNSWYGLNSTTLLRGWNGFFGSSTPKANPTPDEILQKASNYYALTPTQIKAFRDAYTAAPENPNLAARIATALDSTITAPATASPPAASVQPVAPVVDQAAIQREREAQALREKQAREAQQERDRQATLQRERDAEELRKKRELETRQAAPPLATAPAATTPSPFYSYDEVRQGLRDQESPIYQQLKKKYDDMFEQRLANIRASGAEDRVRMANPHILDRNAFVQEQLARYTSNIAVMQGALPSDLPRVTVPTVAPPTVAAPTAAPPVAARTPAVTAGDADTAAVNEAIEARRVAALRSRQATVREPTAATERRDPVPVAPPRQAVVPEPAAAPRVTAPPVASRTTAEPLPQRQETVVPQEVAPPAAAIVPTPAVVGEPVPQSQEAAPPAAVPPAVAHQRPASVYDQFKDNLARAVGVGGQTDLYRAAQEFGKVHSAALRGKGLHLAPEERKKFQEFLFDYGYYQGQRTREQFVDGDFGPETHLAARNLQKATFEAQQQLSVNSHGRKLKDGILGVETARLFEQRTAAPASA